MILFDATVALHRRTPDGSREEMNHTFRIPSADAIRAAVAATRMAYAMVEVFEDVGDNNRYGWKVGEQDPVVTPVGDVDLEPAILDKLPLVGSEDDRVAVVLQMPRPTVDKLIEMQGTLDIGASDLAASYVAQGLDDAARRRVTMTEGLADHLQVIEYLPDGTPITMAKPYPREPPLRW